MKAYTPKIAMCILCLLLSLFVSCTPSYDEQWIVGKTDNEIIDRYGQFDTRYNNYDPEGIYKGWIGVYIIKEERVGYLQTYPKETLKIIFDTNNIAINYRIVLGSPGN